MPKKLCADPHIFIFFQCYFRWIIFVSQGLLFEKSGFILDKLYTRGKKEIHPYYISPIEMRSLWMEIKCVKSATRLLDRIWVNKGGLDLSKEVLWVSVGQRAADLRALKVGGQKKFYRLARFEPASPAMGRSAHLFWHPTLTAHRFDALWPKEIHSTSLERSKPLLLTQSLFETLAALLTYFISIQSDLISMGLM